ncbi:IS110 family transposase [Schinkia azotoformans]|uniref:IS110 family transposase n=1 Tax=Schinkia azotoformans TaxID=1454 RepID=UPI002DBBAB8D|nr:IS110 family transposase [Schinkia azotoformans]MEC1714411.1 IS110 family transposase [Schinkia azotoformans]MEC1743341.1 IS110 family transposase [Schinkia azotoformans]MEC1757249.1 IS110 family transposase [Schinkia azotoformans]MEC1768632.1 IS110 family transposase [Schinkia azotoformans]MEC1773616.1 IS110 family transposase [Schinkia azotoformans]
MSEYQEDVERLDSIPGIATRMAEQILSEVGTNVKEQFLSAPHMCSWTGLVPGNNESAGKRKSTKTRKGKKRAGMVVAHAMLRIAYHLLTRKEMYIDLGEDYFDKQRQQAIVRHSLKRLESLGYTGTITEPEAS